MTKSSILSTLLLVAAVGLFFSFTDPKYKDIKNIKAEVSNYDNALNNSKDLQKVRDALLVRYNNISSEDLKRLELLLPDTVDNIRLVLDIDTIASRYGIVIKNLKLNSSSESSKSEGFDPTVKEIKSVDLSFSVVSDYDTFVAFLRDLEESLRVIDIVEIKFNARENVSNVPATQDVTIRTYWMP